jgi:putative MATE family efflux protein
MIGMIFIYGYNMVSAILRGMGDSRHPFIFISIAAVMNIFLDLLFVLRFHMGAMGAALATVLSQGTSFISCALFLRQQKGNFGFSICWKDFLKPRMGMLEKLIKLGIPMAIKSASVQFSKLFVNSWINSYGVEVSAVAGIANKMNSISNLISNAVNTAGSSMVGQNIGAEKYERIPHIIKTIFVFTSFAAFFMSAALLAFPSQIFSIFTSESEVLTVAMEYLPIAVLVFWGSAFRAPMNALINGSGNYKINFATAILDGLVLRIGLAFLFGLILHMRYIGFWLGDAIASFTPFWLGGIYYFSGTWKTRKYVIKESVE